MRTSALTKGGQISVPADVRRRWGARRVLIEDHGDALVVRPLPEDPIDAALGSLAGPGPTSDEARAIVREEERDHEGRIPGPR